MCGFGPRLCVKFKGNVERQPTRARSYRNTCVQAITVDKDIKADTRFAPWKAKAMEYGYESVLALPLINNGKLSVPLPYSNEPDAFDEDEIMLLSELTQDMAYGIKTLRIRIQHKKPKRT